MNEWRVPRGWGETGLGRFWHVRLGWGRQVFSQVFRRPLRVDKSALARRPRAIPSQRTITVMEKVFSTSSPPGRSYDRVSGGVPELAAW